MGSVPGTGRSLGEGHGNPQQSSCLENPMDRRALWALGEATEHTRWPQRAVKANLRMAGHEGPVPACSVVSESLRPYGL